MTLSAEWRFRYPGNLRRRLRPAEWPIETDSFDRITEILNAIHCRQSESSHKLTTLNNLYKYWQTVKEWRAYDKSHISAVMNNKFYTASLQYRSAYRWGNVRPVTYFNYFARFFHYKHTLHWTAPKLRSYLTHSHYSLQLQHVNHITLRCILVKQFCPPISSHAEHPCS